MASLSCGLGACGLGACEAVTPASYTRPVTRDARLLFVARGLRMFAYGSLTVILVLYPAATGLDGAAIGVVLSLTLVGDTLISLWLTTQADRFGQRRTLVVGGVLMAGAGVVFASTSSFVVLIVAATLGVISPTGSEVGPFLAIEQASLAHVSEDRRRTGIFAWYNLVGSLATATGAPVTGVTLGVLRGSGFSELAADRVVLPGYAPIVTREGHASGRR